MSNFAYDNARELFATAGLNWNSDTIKVMLVSSAYAASASDVYLNVVTNANPPRITSAMTLGSKSATGGACDGGDVTFSAVGGATAAKAILMWKDTGVESTSPLIVYIDTATGLPITPNGGDIIITWDNGTNKIFRV